MHVAIQFLQLLEAQEVQLFDLECLLIVLPFVVRLRALYPSMIEYPAPPAPGIAPSVGHGPFRSSQCPIRRPQRPFVTVV